MTIMDGFSITATQVFAGCFVAEMDNCNDFFVEHEHQLVSHGRMVIQELERAQSTIQGMSSSHRTAVKDRVKQLHDDIRSAYTTLNEEICDLRRFSRVNFDLCVRLLKRFAHVKGNRGTMLLFRLWQSVCGRCYARRASWLIRLSLSFSLGFFFP